MGYTITAADWARYRDTLRSINDKAASLMQDYVLEHGYVINQELIDYAYSLTTTYGEAAGALAVQLYDEMVDYWAASGGAGAKAAEMAAPATRNEVADALFHARDTMGDWAIPQTVEKLVKRSASDTTLKNAIRDGAQFAWIPHGETCAFCLTLASRGWQYASKKALKYGHAEHIHAGCDCQYAVRFDSSTTVEGYDPDQYLKMYEDAEGQTPEEKINSMRRELRDKKVSTNTSKNATLKQAEQFEPTSIRKQKTAAWDAKKGTTSWGLKKKDRLYRDELGSRFMPYETAHIYKANGAQCFKK